MNYNTVYLHVYYDSIDKGTVFLLHMGVKLVCHIDGETAEDVIEYGAEKCIWN
jgi:hypothetical protein